MRLLVADFETRYGNEYTLSRLTTEEYIRDPRFYAHGCGFRIGWDWDHAPFYENGQYIWITHADLPHFLASIDWSDTAMLVQHAQFEGLIFSHHYGVRPAMWLDTLSMANLLLPLQKRSLGALAQFYNLPDKNVPYNLFKDLDFLPPHIENAVADGCLHDVFLNYEIFRKMMAGANGLPPFPASELPVIDATIRLFSEPTLDIDVPRAEALAQRIALQKETILDRLGIDKDALASRECFAELLLELGVEPPMKVSPANGEMTYAFAKNDAGMKELLEHDDLDVAALAAAKLGVSSTIGETRARRMASIGMRGKASLYIRYAAAHTLRPGGGDKFNPLNMPRDGELRSCLVAPKGYRLIVADKNAIECRLVNYLAGQQSVVDAFARGEDVYSILATSIYQRPINKKDDPDQRFVGKTVELGSGYGLGWKALKSKMSTGAMGGKAIPTTEEQAQLYIETYRSTHRKVTDYWKAAGWALGVLYRKGTADWGPMKLDRGYIFLPNGSFLNFTSLHYRDDPDTGKNEMWVSRRNGGSRIYGPKLVENVTQALAWTITTDDIKVLKSEMRIVLYPYDEIVALAPENEADDALKRLIAVMSRTPDWAPGLPVEAEGAHMERYAKP